MDAFRFGILCRKSNYDEHERSKEVYTSIHGISLGLKRHEHRRHAGKGFNFYNTIFNVRLRPQYSLPGVSSFFSLWNVP